MCRYRAGGAVFGGLMTIQFVRACCLAVLAAVATAAAAQAHPHVWVTIKSEIVYAPDGTVTGVRHAWTFDDMFSAFAVQGLELKSKAAPTREELAPLAKVNVESLKEFDYFTYAKADGRKLQFGDPAAGAYWLTYDDARLTLHFTLQVKQPAKAKALDLEVYDPSYFVDFTFVENSPVALAGAPAGCTFNAVKPQDENAAAQAKRLAELPRDAPNDGTNYGMLFANKIVVKCP